ncbi:MAG: peptidyl-prolyl cis-trans isomerase [Acidobacteriota bacterium]
MGALLASTMAARAEVIEEIVARINDDIVTLSSMKERELQIVGALFSRYSGHELDEKVREARAKLLQRMIREILLLQRAEMLGLDTQKIVDVGLEQIKRQNDIKTNDALLRLLREEGTTLDELREQILRVNVPAIMLDREVRQKVSVSDAEVEKYYREHLEEYTIPETITFTELVLRVDGEGGKEKVRARADAIVAELDAGAGFDALVQKYSEVPSREAGGRIGPLRPKELSRSISRALGSLQVGEVSPVVESRYGFHILRVDERVQERQRELSECRDEIEETIREEKTEREIDAYFEKMIKENFIRVSPAYVELTEG